MRRKPVNLKAKSKKLWEQKGYHVANCESRWGGFAWDMFRIADLFAFDENERVFIQVGRWADRAAKLQALKDNEVAPVWLKSKGNRIVLSLWDYEIKHGKRRLYFECREEDFNGI
jgi:hypothetical protein